MIVSTYGKLWRSPACEKLSSFLTFFLRCCKDIAKLLFWVLWACLPMIIETMVSTWIKLWYLSSYKKSWFYSLPFFWLFWACLACLPKSIFSTSRKHFDNTLFFWKYYLLENSEIWLANLITWKSKFCNIRTLWWNIFIYIQITITIW